jgi:hypothetical protein
VPRNETSKHKHNTKDPHLQPPAPTTPTRTPDIVRATLVSSLSTSKQILMRTPINCTAKHSARARHTAEQPQPHAHARAGNSKTATSTHNSTIKRAATARKKHDTRSRQQKQTHSWNHDTDCEYRYTATYNEKANEMAHGIIYAALSRYVRNNQIMI